MEGGDVVIFRTVLDLDGGFNSLSATRGGITKSSVAEPSIGFISRRRVKNGGEGERVNAKGFQEVFEILERVAGSSNGGLK